MSKQVCEHGSLARQCELCERDETIRGLEARVKELVGAEREGQKRYCSDCGRAMVWTSERGESWICPYHVWRRMDRAEERLRSEEYARNRRALRAAEREEGE